MTYELYSDPWEDGGEEPEPERVWLEEQEVEGMADWVLRKAKLDGLKTPPPLRAVARGNELRLIPKAPPTTCGAYDGNSDLYFDPSGSPQQVNGILAHELGHVAAARTRPRVLLYEESIHAVGLAIAMPPGPMRKLLGVAWEPRAVVRAYAHLPAFEVLVRAVLVHGGAAFIWVGDKVTRLVGSASQGWLLPILRDAEAPLHRAIMVDGLDFHHVHGVHAFAFHDHDGTRGVCMYVDPTTMAF